MKQSANGKTKANERQAEGSRPPSPMREMARKSLMHILERSRAFAIIEGSKKSPIASTKPQGEPGLLSPSSAIVNAPARHTRASENEKSVLPVEHILVHKEVKKIFAFCQSGRAATLRNLFLLLESLDRPLHQEGLAEDTQKSAQRQQELEDTQALRNCILRQILTWTTFADQLASAKKEDRTLMNRVYKYLVSKLSGDHDPMPKGLMEEREICWRILFVGWDHLCRSTFQQIEVLSLALTHSKSRIERLCSEDADQSLRG